MRVNFNYEVTTKGKTHETESQYMPFGHHTPLRKSSVPSTNSLTDRVLIPHQEQG